MAYKMTISLTEKNIEDAELLISVETKKQAEVVNKSLKDNGNTVKTELTKEVTF